LLTSIDQRPSGHGRRSEFDLINFFVSALVVGSVLIIRLIFQRQTMLVENEALKRKALQSQYGSLKNQLSPHFLFNSITTLKTLIQESESKARITEFKRWFGA
jgi:LytS/YehU family sensor histidine kinase